jgi:Lon protease-like protein
VDVRTNADGTLAVQVVGQRRFRIRRMDDDRPYLVGQVERVVEMEVEDSPRCDALVLKTREYLKQYFEGHFAQFDMKVAEVRLHEDPTVLSFQVASLLHVDDRQKQYLLEMTDTLERLSTMLPMLEQLILEAEPGPVQPMHRQDHEGWIFKN